MKKIYAYLIIILVVFFITSCDEDYLETPPKHLLDASVFFNTSLELESYTNSFYNQLPGQGNYQEDEYSDNIVPIIISSRVKGTRIVSVPRGSGGWDWSDLRSINYFLDNYNKCPDVDAKKHYGGIARFFRAYFYYKKVKMFGDVPWYGKVVEAGSDDLYKPRDSRKVVMDSVLVDIDYAIENIPAEVELNKITKHTALILKARICLFEGTFRKYHNLDDGQKFLDEAASAASELINSGAYSLFTSGGPDVAYRELFSRDNQDATETILARDYNPDYIRHNMGYLMTAATMGSYGFPKDLVNSYLMSDGSRFTDSPEYKSKEFYDEMQNRDPRLTQTTAGPNYVAYGENQLEPVDLSYSTSGYRVIKALATKDQWSYKNSINDIILFRYAEALLIYAEAKAELGTITQADIDMSINLLRDRVGMPHLNLLDANNNPDPYLENMYINVDKGSNKGVILEIRRERRIELVMEGLRWDDLMRWKEGKKLEKPMIGLYFSGLGAFDFNNDGIMDVYLHDGDASDAPSSITTFINVNERSLTGGTSGYLNPFTGGMFDEAKDYYYPIPLEDLELNSSLEQNSGW